MVSMPGVSPMPAVLTVGGLCRMLLVLAMAAMFGVFGSMTVDGSLTCLARAVLGSKLIVIAVVVVLAMVVDMSRAAGVRRVRRWVGGRASRVVHRVTSRDRRSVRWMGLLSVAARLVGWKVRSRRLLLTTKTLENAMAAPASIGLSRPRAASGMAAML